VDTNVFVGNVFDFDFDNDDIECDFGDDGRDRRDRGDKGEESG